MTARMLGTTSLLEEDETDKHSLDNDESAKKTTKSIKSFFQPPETQDSSKDKNLISSFFKPSEKPAKKIDEVVEVPEAKDSKVAEECITQKGKKNGNLQFESVGKNNSGEAVVIESSSSNDECAVKEGPHTSFKKPKQKWSLMWQVSNKSKLGNLLDSDSDFEGGSIASVAADSKKEMGTEGVEETKDKAEELGHMKKKKKAKKDSDFKGEPKASKKERKKKKQVETKDQAEETSKGKRQKGDSDFEGDSASKKEIKQKEQVEMKDKAEEIQHKKTKLKGKKQEDFEGDTASSLGTDSKKKKLKVETKDQSKEIEHKKKKSKGKKQAKEKEEPKEKDMFNKEQVDKEQKKSEHDNIKNSPDASAVTGKKTDSNNAFAVLMSRPKRQSIDKEDSSKEDTSQTGSDTGLSHNKDSATIKEVETSKEESPTDDSLNSPKLIGNVDAQNINVQISKEVSDNVSSGTNAFELMMKRNRTENQVMKNEKTAEICESSLTDDATKSVKRKTGPFKLNICYSKNVDINFDDYDLEDSANERSVEVEDTSSVKKVNAGKKKTKQAIETEIGSKKKHKLKNRNTNSRKDAVDASSDNNEETEDSIEKEERYPELDLKDCSGPEDNNSSRSKRTKVKDKRKEKKSSKAGRRSVNTPSKDETVQYIISDHSNMSIEEILDPIQHTVQSKKSKKRENKSKINKSSDSDDFVKIPTRTGLRKRIKEIDMEVEGKQEEDACEVQESRDKKQKCQKTKRKADAEVEIVMECQAAPKTKDEVKKPATAPLKLAPIFMPRSKPQATQKTDEPTSKKAKTAFVSDSKSKPQATQKTDSPDVSNTSPAVKDDKMHILSKPIETVEMVAANKVFNSLFSGSRTFKSQFPPTQAVVQVPAPWPTVSHVLQNDDKEEEEFWSLAEPELKGFTKHSDVKEGLPKSFLPALRLGDLTASCCSYNKATHKQETVQSEPLSTSIIRKLLTDISIHYPGVPMRRLFKCYKAKGEESGGCGNPVVLIKKENKAGNEVKGCLEKVEEDLKSVDEEKKTKRRGRPKRKLSIESDKLPAEKQQKKARKGEKVEEADPRNEKDEKEVNTEKLRKKRGRKEEECEEGQKRRSTRLRKQPESDSTNEELENNDSKEDNEVSQKMSKRKKRKTMEDNLEEKGVPKSNKAKKVTVETKKGQDKAASSSVSEDSWVSQDATKRGDDSRDLPWCERYKPTCSSEVMGNASMVGRLRTWLENWKIKREKTLRKELEMQKRLLAKQKKQGKGASSSHTPEWWEEDSDSDFRLSDAESSDSDTEDSGLCNGMLVVGPKGAGKTATVYACARELGYKVFEVNCASKRSSKQILSQLEEATQSHLVITNPSANTPHSSAFGGLFGCLGEKREPATKNPMSAFFKPAEKQDKPEQKAAKKRGRKSKEESKEGRENKHGEMKLGSVGSVGSDSNSHTGLSIKAASLILFEEVDVIFEDDKSFWSAVNSFLRNTKCPIVMTSNDSRVECDGRYEQLTLKSPSINLLSAHLQLAALTNNMLVSPADLKALVSLYGCDIRQCFLALQFWLQSGGGERERYEDYCAKEKVKRDEQGCVKSSQEKDTDLPEGDSLSQTVDSSNQDCTKSADTPMAMLDDAGEESMFLSLDDWKTLRQTRGTRRGNTNTGDGQNSDSDFESSKKSFPVVLEDTNTDSMMECQEANDSRSLLVTGEDVLSVAMPDVHSGLTESTLGMLNCTGVGDGRTSWATLLKDNGRDCIDDIPKSGTLKDMPNLAQFAQHIGVNIISTNLSKLLPKLFVNAHAQTPQAEAEKPKELEIIAPKEKTLSSIFSDKSLFDDGTSSVGDDSNTALSVQDDVVAKGDEPLTDTQGDSVLVIGSGQSRDGDVTTSCKETRPMENDNTKQLNSKALEIFANLSEDASFMDAYTQNPHSDKTRIKPAVYGWWQAHSKAGLSDDVITTRDDRDWLAESRRASIRGAMEVVSLECSYMKYHAMRRLAKESAQEDGQNEENGGENVELPEDLLRYFPARGSEEVIELDELSETQRSSLASRLKLYRTTSASLPVLTHCSHRVACTDYLPALRAVCHAEHLREMANTKRRFLHYLNSNSFPFSRSTNQSLADAYLG